MLNEQLTLLLRQINMLLQLEGKSLLGLYAAGE